SVATRHLADALCNHGVGDLFEACDVCTGDEVAFHAILLGCVVRIVEDGDHDVLQLRVNLFKGPGQTLRVLAHFQTRGCNTACVGSFSRSKQDASGLECFDCTRSRRHVCALCNCHYAVCKQNLCGLFIQLV